MEMGWAPRVKKLDLKSRKKHTVHTKTNHTTNNNDNINPFQTSSLINITLDKYLKAKVCE